MNYLKAENIEIQVNVQDETIPVRGNALASGDDAIDKQAEEEIIAQLEQGNVWAWATVEVVARFIVNGEMICGQAYLGACSYPVNGERSFRHPENGYFAMMIGDAIIDAINMRADIKITLAEKVKLIERESRR